MPEYTDIECYSSETAEALKNYLDSELASIEPEERPDITSYVHKSTLRVTHHGDDRWVNSKTWDMQLVGFRDGYGKGQAGKL